MLETHKTSCKHCNVCPVRCDQGAAHRHHPRDWGRGGHRLGHQQPRVQRQEHRQQHVGRQRGRPGGETGDRGEIFLYILIFLQVDFDAYARARKINTYGQVDIEIIIIIHTSSHYRYLDWLPCNLLSVHGCLLVCCPEQLLQWDQVLWWIWSKETRYDHIKLQRKIL